jgi:hypothetical protein
MNPIIPARALADEERAAAEELSLLARGYVGDPDRREQVHAKGFRQFGCVDRVGLRPRLRDELYVKGMRRVRGDADELQLPDELICL